MQYSHHAPDHFPMVMPETTAVGGTLQLEKYNAKVCKVLYAAIKWPVVEHDRATQKPEADSALQCVNRVIIERFVGKMSKLLGKQ